MVTKEAVITAQRAAEMIYNTPTPSDEQVRRVCEKIARGKLRRSSRGGWTTTSAAVAEYLGSKAASQAALSPKRARQAPEGERMPGFYRDLMKDYFLAILLKRTERRRSLVFTYAVAAMQIALVLLPITVSVFTYRSVIVSRIVSPERRAVNEWLAEQFTEHEVLSLTPLPDDPAKVRVRFWYRQGKSRKKIESNRDFTIANGRVASADMLE